MSSPSTTAPARSSPQVRTSQPPLQIANEEDFRKFNNIPSSPDRIRFINPVPRPVINRSSGMNYSNIEGGRGGHSVVAQRPVATHAPIANPASTPKPLVNSVPEGGIGDPQIMVPGRAADPCPEQNHKAAQLPENTPKDPVDSGVDGQRLITTSAAAPRTDQNHNMAQAPKDTPEGSVSCGITSAARPCPDQHHEMSQAPKDTPEGSVGRSIDAQSLNTNCVASVRPERFERAAQAPQNTPKGLGQAAGGNEGIGPYTIGAQMGANGIWYVPNRAPSATGPITIPLSSAAQRLQSVLQRASCSVQRQRTGKTINRPSRVPPSTSRMHYPYPRSARTIPSKRSSPKWSLPALETSDQDLLPLCSTLQRTDPDLSGMSAVASDAQLLSPQFETNVQTSSLAQSHGPDPSVSPRQTGNILQSAFDSQVSSSVAQSHDTAASISIQQADVMLQHGPDAEASSKTAQDQGVSVSASPEQTNDILRSLFNAEQSDQVREVNQQKRKQYHDTRWLALRERLSKVVRRLINSPKHHRERAVYNIFNSLGVTERREQHRAKKALWMMSQARKGQKTELIITKWLSMVVAYSKNKKRHQMAEQAEDQTLDATAPFCGQGRHTLNCGHSSVLAEECGMNCFHFLGGQVRMSAVHCEECMLGPYLRPDDNCQVSVSYESNETTDMERMESEELSGHSGLVTCSEPAYLADFL